MASCNGARAPDGSEGGVVFDLGGADLGGYSAEGGPCGGFIAMPKQCLPGLVCIHGINPDLAGTCQRPD